MNRRHVLLLPAGIVMAASAAMFAWPKRTFGFGPVSIGMAGDEAMAALGPATFRTALCRGVDGALFDCRDEALRADAPLPAMAMFGGKDGAVSEIEASVSFPDGGWEMDPWRDLVAAQIAELGRRTGADSTERSSRQDDVVAQHIVAWRRAEGTLTLDARRLSRSGAVFSRMHWIAAGMDSVIV